MSGLFGVEHILQPRDGLGRGHSVRLIEDDPAINVGAGGAWLVQSGIFTGQFSSSSGGIMWPTSR